MTLRMRLATEADLDGIADVAMAAFDRAHDPISRNLFPERLQPAVPDPVDPIVAWRRTRKGISLRAERTVLMVVTDDALDGRIVAFSLWEEPVPADCAQDAAQNKQPMVPCVTLDEEAYKVLRSVTEQVTVDCFGKDGSKHLWYLDFLGVHPDYQRKGIGKMLLNWGMDKAQEQGKDVYLIATPAGVPLYKAAGFEELRSFLLFDSPHVCMISKCKPL